MEHIFEFQGIVYRHNPDTVKVLNSEGGQSFCSKCPSNLACVCGYYDPETGAHPDAAELEKVKPCGACTEYGRPEQIWPVKEPYKPLTIELSDGTKVEAERGSYVVQRWGSGKWNTYAVFPPTKEGYAMSQLVMNHLEGEARTQQFM